MFRRCTTFGQRLNHSVFQNHSAIGILNWFRNSKAYIGVAAGGSPRKPKCVGTHNGSFHCDEALSCFMICLTNKFSDAEIVRTHDPNVLEELDAVLDVGGVYDPSRDRYDHHQKGFDEVFGHGFTAKLSTAGLVYKHYGKKLVAKELKLDEGHPDVDRLFLALYRNFIESIQFYAKSWLPARSIVMEYLAVRKEVDPTGEIIMLTRSFPWKLHIFELEEEMKINPSIKYVIYQEIKYIPLLTRLRHSIFEFLV